MLQKLRSNRAHRKDPRIEAYRRLLHQEAVIGSQLFGQPRVGVRREFFCLDEHTWIWHEEWQDEQGGVHQVVTRYDVYAHGIGKAQDNRPYQYIDVTEAERLFRAVDVYNQLVDARLAG